MSKTHTKYVEIRCQQPGCAGIALVSTQMRAHMVGCGFKVRCQKCVDDHRLLVIKTGKAAD